MMKMWMKLFESQIKMPSSDEDASYFLSTLPIFIINPNVFLDFSLSCPYKGCKRMKDDKS